MRFDDDYDGDGSGRISIVMMSLIVSFFILVVLGVVVAVNKKSNKRSDSYQAYLDSKTTVEEVTSVAMERKITADDLDIWNMYPKEKESERPDDFPTPSPMPTISMTPEESQAALDEKMNDGKHTKITYADGSSEWVTINEKWEKNTYDFTNLVASDGKLKYFANGKKVSFVGMDVSRYQGDIDFIQAKESGIDFVMIRVGARGYKTGELTLDEYFAQNIQRATDAGLDVGVYFYSQAITVEEAEKEAEMVIENIQNYKILYPVAIDMEYVENDMSRVESLKNADRTKVTAAFLNKIQAAGYKPMIYGNKEWLLKRIDLGTFTTSSVWLSDEADMPDYPYQFAMWQYTTDGSVKGVTGPVNMDICFIDYRAQ
jgi:GH25 family lysozyme M1 (1,4-beta-N-acetylmuramidase)